MYYNFFLFINIYKLIKIFEQIQIPLKFTPIWK